jgi:hypothetical protein
MCRDDQIIAVNHQIAHRGSGQIHLQWLPMVAIIKGNEYTFFGEAYNRPFRTESSRTQFKKYPSGIPFEANSQFFQKFRVRYK